MDVRRIFNAWEYSQESRAKLDKRREALERENNERRARIKQYQARQAEVRKDYLERSKSLSPEEQQELERSYKSIGRDALALEQDRRDFYMEAKRSLDREVSAEARFIIDKIKEAVQVHALEKKYDMVVESGGHTTLHVPLFLHLEGAVDLTDEIIKRLNHPGNEQGNP